MLDAWHGSLATIGRELKGNFTEFIDLLAKSAKWVFDNFFFIKSDLFWNFTMRIFMFKNVQKNFGKSFEFLFSNFSKNGFGTIRDEQIDQYGPGIIESIDRTWAEVKPLYQKLHAVARFKIDQIFGKKLVKPDGAIPAHLLVRFRNSFFTS